MKQDVIPLCSGQLSLIQVNMLLDIMRLLAQPELGQQQITAQKMHQNM